MIGVFHLELIYKVDDTIVSFSNDSISSMKKTFQILELRYTQTFVQRIFNKNDMITIA